MRMMIITALAVAATAVVVWSHPGLHRRAEGILLAGAHRRVTAQGSTAADQPQRPDGGAASDTGDEATPGPEADGGAQEPAASDATHQSPAEPKQGQPIRLPPPLDRADFGMTRSQIERAFTINWHGADYSGSRPVSVLAHYMTENRSQLAKFRLVDGKLSAIEVNLKPRNEQTLDDLYDTWCRRLTEHHGDAPVAEPARWADQRINVHIGKDTDRRVVRIRYSHTADG
ncbi:MAG: hypothetical protein R6V05_02600 [Candidatus Brocadiia bacterium]